MREELVSALSKDYGVHPYGKWGGAFWRLISLADLGVPPPILGLARYGATDAAARRAEFLLEHEVAYSHRTGELAHPTILRLRYPPYWHYDLLAGLRTVAASVGMGDPRLEKPLDALEEKRHEDGAWHIEGKWWKSQGSKGSNVEVVDWGRSANELLTEQAESVLHLAGRQ